jgi:hypothetical protein
VVQVVNYALPTVTPTAQKAQQRIGGNVGAPTYYSRLREYVDLMQHASGFGIPGQPWKDPAAAGRLPVRVGTDGWPVEDFAMMLMGDLAGTPGLSGEYTVAFKGTATVRAVASSGVTLGTPTRDGDYTVIKLTLSAGAGQIALDFSGTNGTVKDLKVIRPGYNWKDANLPVFTSNLIDWLKPFSTLRFMDTTVTNLLYDARWATRATLENTRGGATQPGGAPGKPWERVIQMANATGSDAWINVPTKADKDYYDNLAALMINNLNPELKIYVEYSNEIWNGSFPQYHWLVSTAIDDEIAAGNSAIFAGLSLDKNPTTGKYVDYYNLGTRVYIERLARISNSFRAALEKCKVDNPARCAGMSMGDKIRPVLAWQGSGSYYVESMLTYLSTAYAPKKPDYFLYGTALAPYFNMGAIQKSTTATVDDVLAALTETVRTTPLNSRFEHNAYLGKKYNLKVMAYEGGPDTFGSGSTASKAGANRDPRMFDLCKTYLNNWADQGGGLFMWFTTGAGNWETNYGTWSVSEYDDPSVAMTPKYACMVWASGTPASVATGRHPPNVAFDAAEVAGTFYPTTDSRYNTVRRWYKLGQQADYVVSSPTAACYRTVITAKNNVAYEDFAPGNGRMEVLVNGVSQGAASPINAVTSSTTPATSDLGQTCLDKGINVLTLKMTVAASGVLDTIKLVP